MNWNIGDTSSCLMLNLLLLLSPAASGGTNKTAQLPPGARPAGWAVPLQKAGLPNLYQVTPTLLRGAQPSQEGMLQLQQMGVKTVVDLRGLHDDEVPSKGTSLSCIHIRFHTWHPEEEDMVQFLRIATDPSKQPVYVHCKRGIDRTGTMIALYRIAIQGWTKEEALREMTQGGFGYDDLFPNLVAYVKKLDVEKIKQKVGITGAGRRAVDKISGHWLLAIGHRPPRWLDQVWQWP